MKHSCGTVALDGLRLDQKKDGWELWFRSYTKQNTTVGQPCWATITIYKIVQTKNMIQVDTIMKNIWPIFVWQCRPSLNWHKTKTNFDKYDTILLYTHTENKNRRQEKKKNYIFRRFWDFAHLLAVFFYFGKMHLCKKEFSRRRLLSVYKEKFYYKG